MKKILKKLKPELKSLITQKKELLKLIKSEKNKLTEINIPKYYVVKDKRLSKLVAKIDKIIEKRKKTQDISVINYRNESLKYLDIYLESIKKKDKENIKSAKKDFIKNYKLFLSHLKKK
jgi:hypothetical protein